MKPVVQVGDDGIVRPCCIPENMTREHTIPQRPDLMIKLCRKCQRRHIRMIAEPGALGVEPTKG